MIQVLIPMLIMSRRSMILKKSSTRLQLIISRRSMIRVMIPKPIMMLLLIQLYLNYLLTILRIANVTGATSSLAIIKN